MDRGILLSRLSPPRAGSTRQRRFLPLVLFLATVLTTTLAGGGHSGQIPDTFYGFIRNGLRFSLPLLFILLTHEMGHFLMAKRWGVGVTLPHFIPFPSFIGTMGAVIRMRGPMPGRNALLDIGAAGPLLGFAAAVIVTAYGVAHSTLVAIPPAQEGAVIYFGESLVFKGLVYLFHGPLPEGMDLRLHPAGFAGWIGFFITSLNLIPMGQLDGGHVLYALLLRRQRHIARLFFLALIPFSFYFSGYLIWMLFGVLMGLGHPPVYDEYSALTPARKIIGVLAVIVFVLTFVPVPVKI